jgi:ribosomal protein S18 acetylase RimI-like enzyme
VSDARVRLATADDAAAIADIHIRSWRTTYRGLVPDAILDGLSMERRIAGWRETIEGQERERAAGSAAVSARTWVVESEDRLVGFAASGPGRDETAPPPDGAGEVYAIYLAPGASGQGYGRTLFAAVVDDLHERAFDPILVWVFEANPAARRFYEAAGFRADGARSTIDFDGTPIDEIRYRLDSA